MITALGMAFCVAGQAQATPIMTFTGGSLLSPGGNTIGGWEFSVSSAITIDGLGLFDDDSDGLDRSHDVGLWTLGAHCSRPRP